MLAFSVGDRENEQAWKDLLDDLQARGVKAIDQKDRQAADQAVAVFIEKYEKVYPTAIACLQQDLEACLTFYAFPKEHWKTMRTTNVIERLEGSVKRRSHKMAAAFRTEGSCLLLFYAVIRSLHFNKLTMPAPSTKQPDTEILHNS